MDKTMAGRKQITAENLKALGVERLADLLVECCDKDAVLAKRVRLVLAAREGGAKLNAAIGKRIASISRSRAMVSWERCHAYVRELDDLRETIAVTLGDASPNEGVERLWEFVALARSVMERLGDAHGEANGVFECAVRDLGRLCLAMDNPDRIDLADKVFRTFDDDGTDVPYLIVEAMGEALGKEGRAHLRSRLRAALADTGAAWRISSALKDLADAENDVDAYIAVVDEDPERAALEAPDIAKRLLAAGRAEEALAWLDKSDMPRWDDGYDRVDLRIAVLEKLDRKAEAQAERLSWFAQTLSIDHLRDHLRRLPDFEDFEAERRAIAHAETFPNALAALSFLACWPDLEATARLVSVREAEIDGRDYMTLNLAAGLLSEKYPDAATRLYRRKVESVLARGASKYYHHAVHDLGSCAHMAGRISSAPDFPSHDSYVSGLRERHGRKHGFWNQLEK